MRVASAINLERIFNVMMIYNNLYDFEVLDKLEDGERVFVLDKEIGEVRIANNMMVDELMQALANSKKETTRYEFWNVEEAEEDEQDA